jgi:hypothetical protein
VAATVTARVTPMSSFIVTLYRLVIVIIVVVIVVAVL